MTERKPRSTTPPGDRQVFVGRASEVAAIRRLIDHADPPLLVLEGEAGIGKTTLLDVACARASRAGLLVVRAGADDVPGGAPLGLLSAALAGIDQTGAPLPRIDPAAFERAGSDPTAAALAASAAVARMTDAVLDVLEPLASDHDLLLALDDLQWADPASLLVLRSIVGRADSLGVRMVLAVRTTPRPHATADLLDRLDACGADRRRLGPLDDAEVAQLVELVTGAPSTEAIQARARRGGGNPFFVRELAMGDDDPDGGADPPLAQMVAQRFRLAGDPVAEALRVAAVLGGPIRPDQLAAVSGRPLAEIADALTQAVDAELLVEADGRLTFRHDLVREAFVSTTPEAVRRAIHRAAGAALGALGAAPEVVAGHLLAGAERGTPATITALREAARGGAPIVTADLLVTALDRCAPNDPQHDHLALEAAEALMWAGRPREAMATADATLARHPDPPVALALRACRSHARFVLGDPSGAVATWIADRSVDDRPEASLELAELALARLFSGDAAGARADAEAAIASPGNRSSLAVATARSVLAWLDASALRLRDALAHADAARAVTTGSSVALLYGPDLMRAAVADAAGDADQVAEALASGRRQVRDHGLVVLEPMLHATSSIHDLRRGRWDDAVASAEAGAAAMADSGIRLAANWLAAVRAIVAVDRGDLDGAVRILDHDVEATSLLGQDWVALARARLLEAQGRGDEALALIGTVVELLAGAGLRSCVGYAGLDAVRLAVATDDELRLASLRAIVDALPTEESPTVAAVAAAATATMERDGAAAARAADLLAACGRQADAARTHAWAACELAAQDPERARAAARAAAAAFAEMGATAPLDRLRADLRTAGLGFRMASVASTDAHGWEALTPTEQRVARLAASALTNAAIAEQLLISRRTVESHLVRTYRKLGLSSRVELSRFVASVDGTAGAEGAS